MLRLSTRRRIMIVSKFMYNYYDLLLIKCFGFQWQDNCRYSTPVPDPRRLDYWVILQVVSWTICNVYFNAIGVAQSAIRNSFIFIMSISPVLFIPYFILCLCWFSHRNAMMFWAYIFFITFYHFYIFSCFCYCLQSSFLLFNPPARPPIFIKIQHCELCRRLAFR